MSAVTGPVNYYIAKITAPAPPVRVNYMPVELSHWRNKN
jgi:hypothetical protein